MIQSIHIIDAGKFKLDGGAMFGVVPKSMWCKMNPPDDNNMCTWGLSCLLIRTQDRNILVDTGMGTKQDERFRSHFSPHGDGSIEKSLTKLGLTVSDITDVFLTHLHFDHCGGAVERTKEGVLQPAFPNAVYWTNEKHWNWAMQPNDREKASFLKENFVPLLEHNKLKYIDFSQDVIDWIEGIKIHFFYGHTEALMGLEFEYVGRTYWYTADLIPSSYHISLPFVMAYDVRPLLTLKEKEFVLNELVVKKGILILEHDPLQDACTVKVNESKRIVLDEYVRIG